MGKLLLESISDETRIQMQIMEERERRRGQFVYDVSPCGPLHITGERITCERTPDEVAIHAVATKLKMDFPAQSYGSHMESMALKMFGLKKVSPSEKLGDARYPDVGEIEVKASITTRGVFSVRQVRIHRPIDYYLLFFVSVTTPYVFLGFVPSETIKEMAVHRTHGCKGSVEGDDPERSFDIHLDSPELARLEPFNLCS